ncbi:dephospho-CoA kinase [Actinomyces minihominis]|uniref:dephospho-CoA kinase n=1 Tax=Actinomyces minihominis TaxID=2002838 RepID=UPI001A91882D|nr:dephospho-CoA kinase [Actinomyces minihominis]
MKEVEQIRVGGAVATWLRPWVRPNHRPIYVGLSGGIGAGKSTVAAELARQGALVLSADEVAREVVKPGSSGLEEIRNHFGPGVINSDGSLNRFQLGQRVFESPEQREVLEAITHPRIAKVVQHWRQGGRPGEVLVYDVPLLVESRMEADFDCVIMVQAGVDQRVARLEGRGMDSSSARARINAQIGDEVRRQFANIWIENHGGESELSELASRVFVTWIHPDS